MDGRWAGDGPTGADWDWGRGTWDVGRTCTCTLGTWGVAWGGGGGRPGAAARGRAAGCYMY
jgi:hypothetical protein